MSEQTEQSLQERIEAKNAEKRVVDADRETNAARQDTLLGESLKLAAELDDLKLSLKTIRETPKKPEPRHGDFGYPKQRPSHSVIKTHKGCEPEQGPHGQTDWTREDSHGPNPYIKVGNVHDLMQQAGDGGVIVALTKEEAKYVILPGDARWCTDSMLSVVSKIKAALDRQK